MKKPKSSGTSRMITAATVDEYFAQVPEPHLTLLQKARSTIRKAAPPQTTETMSYGMPTFKYQGSVVCIAAFVEHCSLFPMGGATIEKYNSRLGTFLDRILAAQLRHGE